jgi:hypothetical protein
MTILQALAILKDRGQSVIQFAGQFVNLFWNCRVVGFVVVGLKAKAGLRFCRLSP